MDNNTVNFSAIINSQADRIIDQETSIKILLRTIEKLEGKISETNKLMDLACTNLEDGFPDKALKIIYQIRKNG